jgi:dihydroorotase
VATFYKGHPTVLGGKLNTPYRETAATAAGAS